MQLHQVGAQLFTVRDFCQNAADFAATAKKIRAIGYTAVQLSGVGPIPEAEITAILRGEDLTLCATHEPGNVILDEPAKVVDRLRALGCGLTAYPFPKDVDFTNPAHVETLVTKLDAAGAHLRAAGLRLSYHNHGIEFVRHRGAPALETIYARTDPLNISAELDTYWIHYGGGDVVAWCRKLHGRLPLIHLKDYGYTPDNKPTYCEIGQGTLPFPAIIAAAEASGCKWFVVEQDTCPGNPFDSLKISFDYIKAHLIAP